MNKSKELLRLIKGRFNFDNSVGKALCLSHKVTHLSHRSETPFELTRTNWSAIKGESDIFEKAKLLEKFIEDHGEVLVRVTTPMTEDLLSSLHDSCTRVEKSVNPKYAIEEIQEELSDFFDEWNITTTD